MSELERIWKKATVA